MSSTWDYMKKQAVKVDFIGPQFFLEHNDSSRFQSFQGVLWSLICVITCATIGFMFGKEIYQRKNPMVSISQQFVSYSDVWLSEFPLMFSFISMAGKSLSIDDINSYMAPVIFMQYMDINGKVLNNSRNYEMEPCDPTHYDMYQDLVQEKLDTNKGKTDPVNFLCMKHDDKALFSNSYMGVNSTNLNIKFKKCDPNHGGINCAADLNEVVQDMLVTISYVTSFVDFYNYSNPVLTYMDDLTTQTSLFLTRRSYFRFNYNSFVSDDGILLEDKKITDFIYLYGVVPDDYLNAPAGPDLDILFWLALESPKISNLIARNYMKVQDLLAKIGGLVNAIIIITRVITTHYLRFQYLYSMKAVALDCILQNELEQSIIRNLNENNNNKDINFDVSNFKIEKEIEDDKDQPSFVKKNSNDSLENDRSQKKMVESPDDSNNRLNNVNVFNLNKNNNKETKSTNTHDANIKVSKFMNNNKKDIELGNSNQKAKEERNKRKEREEIEKDRKREEDVQKPKKMEVKDSEESDKRREFAMIKSLSSKKSFYSPSVVSKLNENTAELGYFRYLFSLLFCRKETYQKFESQLRAVRKVLSIHTYCKLVINTYNSNSEKSILNEDN